ncbi:hypothetical protein [Falsirhodobacter sp. alg1]|uniref:hypothetical protein n=1 Tax=Falsirhodobacter sp. alg1 TaxID=1472418 RepID=UPI0005EE0DDA|nr:hypothetical protein [Falsirhodobacter sp. alg1]
MTKLDRLHQIAQLLLDTKLAEVQRTAKVRETSLSHLAALKTAPQNAGPDVLLEIQTVLRYERWADVRRAEINARLAQQTADWMEAQDNARMAFGRAEVLRKLASR